MTITASIVGGSFVTVMMNGKTVTVNSDHINYSAIREALKRKDHDQVERLVNVKASVINFAQGQVKIVNESVFYGDMEVGGPVVERILGMVREGFDSQPMMKFLANLMENPSRRAVTELYSFLEESELPITEDGCFLAYKKVNHNYKDLYSGKFDNSVGAVVKMVRNQVDEERDHLCSYGLHFCSLSYLPNYWGGQGKVMIVKINPKDVVSIPSDYNNAKGRCCEYVVVGEHTEGETTHAFTSPVYNDAVPVSAPVATPADPMLPPTWKKGWNADAAQAQNGLVGYNNGRRDAASGASFNNMVDVYNIGYSDAYSKGWNSIVNPSTPSKATVSVTPIDDDEFDLGYEAGSLAASADNDAKRPYNDEVVGTFSDDYVRGYLEAYGFDYYVDWSNEGSEAGERDADNNSLYNDEPPVKLDDTDEYDYKEGYADGWKEAKVSKI